MPRIVGVDVPNNRPTWIALTYIHGVGRYTAGRILKEAGIEGKMRAGDLTEDEVSRITQIIDRDYIVEGQLRRQVGQNITRLRDIACYRGIRHRRGLPVRGQQTQSNARTRKGKKKTVAGKKGVKEAR
jgi:small subunit ribosomal protein S13